MLSYLSAGGQKTHIVDELAPRAAGELRRTICGRTCHGGTVQESDRLPGCRVCARELRRLKKGPPTAEPQHAEDRAEATESDLLCPVCGSVMGLAVRRVSLPTRRVNAVRVMMMLLCTNDDAHGDPPAGLGEKAARAGR